MRVDISSGKGTSGMDEFGSVIDRMNMKLGSNFLKVFENQGPAPEKAPACANCRWPQRVTIVDGATHYQNYPY